MAKILLLDNDPNFRNVFRHQLLEMGVEVDGVAGCEAVGKGCYGAITTPSYLHSTALGGLVATASTQ